MRRVSFHTVLAALLLCCVYVWAGGFGQVRAAQPPSGARPVAAAAPAEPDSPEQLYSPAVAEKLHELAYELGKSEDPTPVEIAEAIVLLKAAVRLDPGADYVKPTLIEIACIDMQHDRSSLVKTMLEKYIDTSADLAVAEKAVEYLLDKADSREQREQILRSLGFAVGNKNIIFGASLISRLGMLAAEKPDRQSAGYYLTQAYKSNKHDKAAFTKLAELFPDRLGPEYYLEHLRLVLRENPANLETALKLAQYAERLELYETASQAYRYCADLFDYLYPDQPLPARVYIPWALSSYNTDKGQHKCIEIANMVRQSGRFDILVEALAGKAATKLGDSEQATAIFAAAAEKANQLLKQGPGKSKAGSQNPLESAGDQVTAAQFAWFYCFALPDPEEALNWANRAHAIEPNSPSVAGILAYALVMNGQNQWAKPLIQSNPRTQISELALAKMQIADNDTDSAKETLNALIARDPGSLAAEQAKALLKDLGAEYIPPIHPDVISDLLKSAFGESFIPVFTPLHETISVQFNIRGNKFPYGSTFGAVVVVVNNSDEPLIITDDGLFTGRIRIDAEVTGDLSASIPRLVSVTVRKQPWIEPGKSMLIPVKLVTGRLRRMLMTYPQASLNIEFTLYLDPVVTETGQLSNGLSKLPPTRLAVTRPGIELTSKYLRNRFNLISQGQQGQKVRTAQLFIGLLMEQYAMSNHVPPYKFVYADWMPTMFRNALLHESGLLRNQADGEWPVKTLTMAEMLYLPLDHELVSAVSERLTSDKWPVRMMALYLLAQSQRDGFTKVLEWAVGHDQDRLVREMALAISGAERPRAATAEPSPPSEPNEPAPEKSGQRPPKQ